MSGGEEKQEQQSEYSLPCNRDPGSFAGLMADVGDVPAAVVGRMLGDRFAKEWSPEDQKVRSGCGLFKKSVTKGEDRPFVYSGKRVTAKG